MASRIKGITIEIGGDTTKLQTALKGVNTEIRSTQRELKDVEKLLKLDPGNTELLAQKHKLLGQAVSETKEKLETLKTAAEQAEKALEDGTISKNQYDALQREIIETEQELKRLEEQANQSATALQKIAASGEKWKTVGDNISSAGQKLLPVTGIVTAAGTAAVKIAADFESAMSKVAAVSDATGSDLDALTKKAREMGSRTKFSASEAAEAMNYMAMAGWKTEDMLNGLDGVMNLAAASGESLGTTSGAINNCDGAAQKMADTMNDNLEGQLTILKSALEELAISFGQLLIPALKEVVQWLQGFVGFLNSLPEGVKKTIMVIALVAAALGPVLIIVGKVISSIGTIMTIVPKLAGVIGTVQKAFAALNVTMLANPIALIIASITALVAAFIYLWNTNEEFRQFWISLWEDVKRVAVEVWEAISRFMSRAWEAIRQTAVTVWNGIAGFFTVIWNGIKTTVTTVANTISSFLNTAWNAVRTTVVTVWTAISTFFSTIWNGIRTVVSTVVNAISTFLSTAWNSIRNVIVTVMKAIQTVCSTVWNGIRKTITAIVTGIRNTISTAWNSIKNTVASVVNALKSAVGGAFTSMWNGIRSTVSGIYNTIRSGFGQAVSYITGLASNAFRWGADLINGIVNGIRSAIGNVVGAVRDVANTIRSHLHFSVPDEGPLTDYESWMPDFMEGLAQGIGKSKGMVKDAVNSLAADMVISPNVRTTDMAVAGGGSVCSADLNSLVGAIREAVGGISGNNGDIVIPVYLGGTMLDEVIVNAQQRANLRSGGR